MTSLVHSPSTTESLAIKEKHSLDSCIGPDERVTNGSSLSTDAQEDNDEDSASAELYATGVDILKEEDVVQKHTIVFTPMLVLSMISVITFAPLANLSSKWAFTTKAYGVPPSDITESTERHEFDDNVAQIMFKHSFTLLWCLFFFIYDYYGRYKKGKHPWFTTRKMIEDHAELDQRVVSKILLRSSIPAFCDFAFSMCQSAATKMIRTSTVQMLANLQVLLVAFLSMLILKKAITLGQWLGIFIVVIGVVLSGADGILYPDVNSLDDNYALAICLVLMAAFLRSLATILEQKLISGRPIPTFKLYAVEQAFATLFVAATMLIKYIAGSNKLAESFWQMVDEPKLFFIMCLHGFAACMLNSFAILIALLSNPIFRILCMSTRTISSWIIEMIIGWNTFELVTLFGQIALAVGVVLYTGVLYPSRWVKLRRPCTIGDRLTPTPDAVLTASQMAKRERKHQKNMTA